MYTRAKKEPAVTPSIAPAAMKGRLSSRAWAAEEAIVPNTGLPCAYCHCPHRRAPTASPRPRTSPNAQRRATSLFMRYSCAGDGGIPTGRGQEGSKQYKPSAPGGQADPTVNLLGRSVSGGARAGRIHAPRPPAAGISPRGALQAAASAPPQAYSGAALAAMARVIFQER